MNIITTEQPSSIIAKIDNTVYNKNENNNYSAKRVTYMFVVDAYPSLCSDKRDIILEELNASYRLLEYATEYDIDEIDKKTIEEEILYLEKSLSLIP